MPSDAAQSHVKRPNLESHRSNSSQRVLKAHNDILDSPSNTPPSVSHKFKTTKAHVAGHRLHTRVQSSKGLHKLSQAHPPDHVKAHRRALSSTGTSPVTSPMKRVQSDTKLSRNSSATSLKKNSSHTSLKRNRSHVEVKRPKSAGQLKRSSSHAAVDKKALQKTSVHFDLGNDGPDDGWTEASGSASPNLSRSGSIGGASSGRNSAKPPASANNSQPHSPKQSPTKSNVVVKDWSQKERHGAPDAHQITSRLLQRTPSSNPPPQMSSISVTATSNNHSPEPYQKVDKFDTVNGTPYTVKDELVSRFKGSAPGTPGSTSPLLQSNTSNPQKPDLDEARRVKSMGNLNRKNSNFDHDEEEDRAIGGQRSRQSSIHAYNPAQQSRTQQKLWLQRASSNIEPQQMAPGPVINGMAGLHIGPNMPPLVGASYDGRDPRIRIQLERTGLEYLVVRRHQDPIGRALKRLDFLPGAEKNRRIPRKQKHNGEAGGQGKYGLSQSLKDMKNRERGSGTVTASGTRSSYEGPVSGSVGSERSAGDDDGVGAILRSLWDKNFDMSASAE